MFVSRGKTIRIESLDKTPFNELLKKYVEAKFTGRIDSIIVVNNESYKVQIELLNGEPTLSVVISQKRGDIYMGSETLPLLETIASKPHTGYAEIIELTEEKVMIDMDYLRNAQLTDDLREKLLRIGRKRIPAEETTTEVQTATLPRIKETREETLRRIKLDTVLCDIVKLIKLAMSSKIIEVKSLADISQAIKYGQELSKKACKENDLLYIVIKVREGRIRVLYDRKGEIVSISLEREGEVICGFDVIEEIPLEKTEVKAVYSIVPRTLLKD